MSKRQLPPLEPLIAFEASARLLSFTRAGEELHLTQAAVSQQIRSLEQSLNVKLFTRAHRAVQLTREGREYQHTVALVLRQLAGATTDIKHVELAQKINLACDLSIAQLWLAPRLSALKQNFFQYSLQILASDDDSVCLGKDVQIAIIQGDGQWPGFQAIRLFDEEVFPVCSPQYGLPGNEQDWAGWLAESALIDLEDNHWNWMNWRNWFGANQIDLALQHRRLSINNYPMVLEAARQGQGVALGWAVLVDPFLADGSLIRPVQSSIQTDFGYYLLISEQSQNDEVVHKLGEWIQSQFSNPRELA